MLRQDKRTSWPESGTAVGRPVALPTRTSRRSAPRMRLSNESRSRSLPGGRHDATFLLGEAARLASILSCSALVVRPGMRRIIAAARRFPAPDIAVVPGPGYHRLVSNATAGPSSASALRRCDLHLHTRYSSWPHARVLRARDSYTEPVDLFERAKAAGMDYVAITDHDSIEGALRLLDALPGRASEIIVGEEVETRFADTGQRLHTNVFGLDEK